MRKDREGPVIKRLQKLFKNIKRDIKRNTFLFDGAKYKPDLVLRDSKHDNIIKAIIEVEGRGRKKMVGGVITADYCMGIKKQKPIMLILVLDESDKKDYQKRIPMLEHYATNLEKIIIDDKKHIISRLKEIH